MTSQPSLPEKVMAIDERLKAARIPHAFGGALALAYYAEPRATVDIDVNVFVPTSRVDEVSEALRPLGIGTLENEQDRTAFERDGQCRWWWGRTPIDLFFSYDEVHEAMAKATRRVPFAEDEFDILGPEHLTFCKAIFDRVKDWLDIEQVMVTIERFDAKEVEGWLVRAVGEDNHRVRRFRELVAELRDEPG